MSAPVLTAITPANNQADVILGTPITVTFDQPIDPKTVNSATFTLFGPGVNTILGASQLLQNAAVQTGREFVTGSFSWPLPTQFVFTLTRTLRPKVKYTVVLAGGISPTANAIRNPSGEALRASQQISFSTGIIDQSVLPPSSPIPWNDPSTQPWMRPTLDPATIMIRPVLAEGNDLTQQIVLTFPAALKLTSFDPAAIGISVEALANDPLIRLPQNPQYKVVVIENQILITVGNWPPSRRPLQVRTALPSALRWLTLAGPAFPIWFAAVPGGSAFPLAAPTEAAAHPAWPQVFGPGLPVWSPLTPSLFPAGPFGPVPDPTGIPVPPFADGSSPWTINGQPLMNPAGQQPDACAQALPEPPPPSTAFEPGEWPFNFYEEGP